MYNKLTLEGKIIAYEYVTQSDDTIIVNGTILSNSDDVNCSLFFYFTGNLAKQYYKKIFVNTKALLDGKLEFKQWKESNGTPRARYMLKVTDLKIIRKKFNILYSSDDNSFIL